MLPNGVVAPKSIQQGVIVRITRPLRDQERVMLAWTSSRRHNPEAELCRPNRRTTGQRWLVFRAARGTLGDAYPPLTAAAQILGRPRVACTRRSNRRPYDGQSKGE